MPKEESLHDIFRELLYDPKLYPALRPAIVLNAWEEIVGKLVSKRTAAIKIENSTLIVNVNSHSMLDELELQKKIILEKYHKRFGKKIIKDIHFRSGAISTPKPADEPFTKNKKGIPVNIIQNAKPLPEEITEGVSDEVLKELGGTMAKISAAIEWNNENS